MTGERRRVPPLWPHRDEWVLILILATVLAIAIARGGIR